MGWDQTIWPQKAADHIKRDYNKRLLLYYYIGSSTRYARTTLFSFYKIRHNYWLKSANDLKFSGYISETITNNFLADSLTKSKIRNRLFQVEISKLKCPYTNWADKQLITQILINSNEFFHDNYIELISIKVCFKFHRNRWTIDQVIAV